MLQTFLALDKSIVFFLNGTKFKLLDYLMWFISFLGNYAAIWLFLGLIALFYDKKKGRKIFSILIFALLLILLLNDFLIPQIISRERPYEVLQGVRIIGNLPIDNSFPSSHAASAFAGAFIFSLFYRKFKIYFYSFAILTAISRIYLAAHYPSDVVGGAIEGILIALILLYTDKKCLSKKLIQA